MRIVLFTGKGGVGKSTVAAGTAALAAASGRRTLVLSTDAAHSLADAFGAGHIGTEPTEVAPNLFVEQVDAQLRFEQSWAEVQQYLLSVLEVIGVDPLAAEEMTVIPGAEEVFALLELRRRAREGQWEVIVVDCAPTGETLRLLALPEALGWYIQRVLPWQRRVVKAFKPVLSHTAGVPMPGDTVFDAAARFHTELDEARALLSGPDASVRLVLTPERVVLAEARRSWTTLSLYGYRVDGVVANRIFPAEGADDWRAGWVAAQDDVLAEVEASFAGLPLWRSLYRVREPVGVPALTDLARDLYAGPGSADPDPVAPATGEQPFRVTRGRASTVVHLTLPGIDDWLDKEQVQLGRNGDELVLTLRPADTTTAPEREVGSYRRVLTLPAGLARLRVAGARVEQGELQVRFVEPDRGDDAAGTGTPTETGEEQA